VQLGEYLHQLRHLVEFERVQRVREPARRDGHVLEDDDVASRQRVECRTVGARHPVTEFVRQVAIEAGLGLAEACEFTEHACGGGGGGDLDEHRARQVRPGERQPSA
jgi:hypothetical protein